MKKIIWIIGCLWAISSEAEEFRTFTASNGKELKAKVVSYDSVKGKVQIQREDKVQRTVPVTAFCEADQKYIRSWSAASIFQSTSKFKLELKRNVGDAKKEAHSVDMSAEENSGGGRRGGGGLREVAVDKKTPYKYTLTLENKGGEELKGLMMEYRIYYEQEKAERDPEQLAEEKDSGETFENTRQRFLPVLEEKVKEGKVRVGTLEVKASKEVATGSVTLLERSANGRGYMDKINLKADVKGVWVKVFYKSPSGEQIVREVALPPSVPKKFLWDQPDEDEEVIEE